MNKRNNLISTFLIVGLVLLVAMLLGACGNGSVPLGEGYADYSGKGVYIVADESHGIPMNKYHGVYIPEDDVIILNADHSMEELILMLDDALAARREPSDSAGDD